MSAAHKAPAPPHCVDVSEQAIYFDQLYTGNRDPWQVRDSWYERRKRAVLLAALPRERYGLAFEPGCGTGELTDALAARCMAVHASDLSAAAIEIAAQRVGHHGNVQLDQRALPADWPRDSSSRYDLIVVSELAYYLDDAALVQFTARCADSLSAGGELLLCHWRHPFHDRLQDTATVHATCDQLPGMRCVVRHQDTDFLLQVWRRKQDADAEALP